MIYLGVFFISYTFIYLVECSRRISKKQRKIVMMIAAFLPIVLAALRGSHIGTDMGEYVISVVDSCLKAKRISEIAFLNKWDTISIEWGYLLVNYFVSRYTHSLPILLLVIYSINIGLVFSTYEYFKDKIDMQSAVIILETYLRSIKNEN